MDNQKLGSYAENSKPTLLKSFKNCLSAAITQTKLSHRQKVAFNTGINNVYALLMPYGICYYNSSNQGFPEGKTDKNIIYKYFDTDIKLNPVNLLMYWSLHGAILKP
jgi:hypothetical protein